MRASCWITLIREIRRLSAERQRAYYSQAVIRHFHTDKDQSMILKSHTILYVENQANSTAFYTAVLDKKPRLDVPGMTEFELGQDSILGFMPKTGILRLLGDKLPNPEISTGLLRAELYLIVDDPEAYYQRALRSGAQELSALAVRDWGHIAAYCLDLDGHVLVFAAELDT